MTTRGKFITLDGNEGVGKSTQLARIADWLRARNRPFYLTREPGGTALGEKLRALFLDPDLSIGADSELLLILAARNEHLLQEIRPRLARGQWVVSDRYNDATYAYQGAARGIDPARIAALEAWLPAYLEPDLRLILGADADVAAARIVRRGNLPDRMEQENAAFFAAVDAGFRARAQAANACWIDANGSPDDVFAQIQTALERL